MKTFFLIQIAISILLASKFILSPSSSSVAKNLFQDKISTIQSSRKKIIQYYKQKKTSRKNQRKKSARRPQKNKDTLSPSLPGTNSELEVLILEAGINPNLIQPWINHKQLAAIHFRKDSKDPLIIKNFKFTSPPSEGKILQLSSQRAIEEIKDERNQDLNKEDENKDEQEDSEEQEKYKKISKQSFRVISFTPGLRDNKEPIKKPLSYAHSIKGPDHHFNHIDPTNLKDLQILKERTISLGHGGEIILQITQGGFILDKKGPDFAIFENPFQIGADLIYQEFARVAVASENKPEAYKWFPCNPTKSVLLNCAGVIPTNQGGDLFDLSTLDIDQVRFIKIKDIGTNLSNYGDNTEGFDLDSLKIIHAFKENPLPAEPPPEDETEK